MLRGKYKRNSHYQLVTIVQLSGFGKKFFLPRKALNVGHCTILYYVLVFRSKKEDARGGKIALNSAFLHFVVAGRYCSLSLAHFSLSSSRFSCAIHTAPVPPPPMMVVQRLAWLRHWCKIWRHKSTLVQRMARLPAPISNLSHTATAAFLLFLSLFKLLVCTGPNNLLKSRV